MFNEGFAMNWDIYTGIKDVAFYPFSLYIKNKETSYFFEGISGKPTVHELNAPEDVKQAATYFYLELTESENEVSLLLDQIYFPVF